MNTSSSPNGERLPAFVPAFYASSYDELDELEFSAEQVHSDNGVAFIAPAAPAAFSADMAAAHHHFHEDEDDSLFVSKTKYRDTQHVFANGPCDLVFNSESFSESSFFSKPGKSPVFVLENAPKKMGLASQEFSISASPLSPSSYSGKVDVPQKESCGYFCVNPCMPSRQSPTKIMDALKTALLALDDCVFEVVNPWTIKVNLLCVAEEISFAIELSRVGGAASSSSEDNYEVDFLRVSGDETKFAQLTEFIRSLCGEVDDEALPFLSSSLDPWVDAKQEISGRRAVISEKEAAMLLEELHAELHPDTLYEVVKSVKNHCRHKGNRKLFLQTDHQSLLKALKWTLTDGCDDVARFGVFILQQFAKDQGVDGADDCSSPFFLSPYDKSSFALLLEDVVARQSELPCGKFTAAMVEQVQQSWVFA